MLASGAVTMFDVHHEGCPACKRYFCNNL